MTTLTHYDIVKCLEILRPGSSWTLDGTDLDNLVWEDSDTTPPTISEIEVCHQQMMDEQEQIEQEKQNLKQAALDHLVQNLGLSLEMAKVIVGTE